MKLTTVISHAVRCEGQTDIGHFLVNADDYCDRHEASFRAVCFQFVAVGIGYYVYFFTDLSLEQLRELMRTIPDGHVMVESVNSIDEFTGDRYWDDERREVYSS